MQLVLVVLAVLMVLAVLGLPAVLAVLLVLELPALVALLSLSLQVSLETSTCRTSTCHIRGRDTEILATRCILALGNSRPSAVFEDTECR